MFWKKRVDQTARRDVYFSSDRKEENAGYCNNKISTSL